MKEALFLICYFGLFTATFFALIRLIKGPSNLDRILAFDSIALCTAGMIIVYSIQNSTAYFLEVLIIFSLLGFTTVLGYLDYLGRLQEKLKQKVTKNYDLE